MVVNRFLKYGEEFAYIRRYKPELKKSVPAFFDALISNNEFPNHSFTTRRK